MRLKIVLAILLPALVVIGAIILVKPRPPARVPEVAPAPAVSTAPAPAPAPVWTPPPAPVPVAAKKAPPPEESQAAIDAETERLSDWAMNDDPQSLSNILNDLNSPEKEIRMAAVDAAEQFESTNAIPALRAAAANAPDSEEAIAMLKAADWLALPTANFQSAPPTTPQRTPQQQQAVEQSQAAAAARYRAYMQAHHPNAPQSGSAPATPPANGQNSPTAPNNQ